MIPRRNRRRVTESARELASLVGWRPYMHDPALPHVLRRLRKLPTLIVWGHQDAIVPLSAGEAYHRAIPGSRLVVLDHCGRRRKLSRLTNLCVWSASFCRTRE